MGERPLVRNPHTIDIRAVVVNGSPPFHGQRETTCLGTIVSHFGRSVLTFLPADDVCDRMVDTDDLLRGLVMVSVVLNIGHHYLQYCLWAAEPYVYVDVEILAVCRRYGRVEWKLTHGTTRGLGVRWRVDHAASPFPSAQPEAQMKCPRTDARFMMQDAGRGRKGESRYVLTQEALLRFLWRSWRDVAICACPPIWLRPSGRICCNFNRPPSARSCTHETIRPKAAGSPTATA